MWISCCSASPRVRHVSPLPQMPNSTAMLGFLLMRFADAWELRVLHAVSFSLLYLVTITGNVLIVAATTLDRGLHTPMYFFLRNLSVLDACFVSVTVPKSFMNSLLNSSAISVVGCAAQVFLVVLFVYLELLFLTFMAHDRYVAICQPLHYTVIMSPRVCVQATLAALLSGLIYAGVHTGSTFRLSFCRSRVVRQFFCDIPSLLRLSCADTFSNEVVILVCGLVFGGSCFSFIIRSYVHILFMVFRLPKGADRSKAFSTCVPHILVVTIFLTSSFYVYLRPAAISAALQDVVLSVFYTIIPPLFNPIIYSLRNKQIKGAIKKITKARFV
ncbi:olfactory receptor 14C36-like [Ochotona curzoniae]|uniref:olfactory receptor 14C36-like n=1 Tax=Ochotona curzoniae TaxID=130825 RepID=UPI001B345F41|nr:olfactory receptor 14C36-like [Ochotona curzoniae]